MPMTLLHPESWAARATEAWAAIEEELSTTGTKGDTTDAGGARCSYCWSALRTLYRWPHPPLTPSLPAGTESAKPFRTLTIEEHASAMLENPLFGR